MCFGYNNALLSGSMDIIVVKQPNGKFKASPLRLRFSNYRVPKAGKKKVTVKVNQKIVDVPMFLQKDGTAFILLENKKYKKEKEKENDIINEKNKSKFYETRNDKHNSHSLSPNHINNKSDNQSIDSNDNNNKNCDDNSINSIIINTEKKINRKKL